MKKKRETEQNNDNAKQVNGWKNERRERERECLRVSVSVRAMAL